MARVAKIKRFVGSHLDKILERNDVRKMWPGCRVQIKMVATVFKFWASLEAIGKTCTSEAGTSVSG